MVHKIFNGIVPLCILSILISILFTSIIFFSTPNLGLLAFFLPAYFFIFLSGVLLFIIMIFMIIDCITRKFPHIGYKLIWIVLIFLSGGIVGIPYYYVISKRLNPKPFLFVLFFVFLIIGINFIPEADNNSLEKPEMRTYTAPGGVLSYEYEGPDYVPEGFYKNEFGDTNYYVQFDKKYLSYNKELKKYDPEFFMQDYYLNSNCASFLDQHQSELKCPYPLGCDSDIYDLFRKMCFRDIARISNDTSICEHSFPPGDCYSAVAIQNLDEQTCLLSPGDLSIMDCLDYIAEQKQDPGICNLLIDFYEERLEAKDLDISKAKDINPEWVEECIKKASKYSDMKELIECKRFRGVEMTECVSFIDKIKKVTMEDCFSTPTFRFKRVGDCLKFFQGKNGYDIYPYAAKDEKFGNNICKFDSFPEGESIEVAGLTFQKIFSSPTNYISLMPVFYEDEMPCGTLGCYTYLDLSNVSQWGGVHATLQKVPKAGKGNCELKEIHSVQKMLN